MAFAPVFGRPFTSTFDRRAAGVPIAFVQKNLSVDAVQSQSLAFTSDTRAGNTIVVMIWWSANAVSVASVNDTQGNTYYAASGVSGGGGFKLHIWYAHAISGGPNTITATLSDVSSIQVSIYEYAGLVNKSPDTSASGSSGSATSIDTGLTPTITKANSLLFGAAISNAGVSSVTHHADFTTRVIQPAAGSGRLHLGADRIVSAIGQYNFTAAWTTARAVTAQIIVFQGQL